MTTSRRTLLTIGALSLTGCTNFNIDNVSVGESTPTEDIKKRAEAIAYDELYRNIGSHKNDAVHYKRVLITSFEKQSEDEQRFYGSLSTSNETNLHEIYCTYDDNTMFRAYDYVELWGVVKGLKTYELGNQEKSVPMIRVADMQLDE